MWENTPVDTHFYVLFCFNHNLGDLNGPLHVQNHDTPVGELSQASGEASWFKIGYFCVILRLRKRCDFFAKLTKNDDFLHFLTSECTLMNRTIKMKVFVISFGVRGESFTTMGVPIVEIFTRKASEMDKLCVKQRRNSIKMPPAWFFLR